MADEPVSSLDASVRGEILALLLQAARRARAGRPGRHPRPRAGLEHRRPDRGDVPRPDRRGRAPPRRCCLQPQHPYTQALLSVVPEMEAIEQVVLPGDARPDPRSRPAAGSTPAARPWRAVRRPPRTSRTCAPARPCRSSTPRASTARRAGCRWADPRPEAGFLRRSTCRRIPQGGHCRRRGKLRSQRRSATTSPSSVAVRSIRTS